VGRSGTYKRNTQAEPEESESESESESQSAVSVNSVNIVHSVNKVVNPHKDNYHYVGGVPHILLILFGTAGLSVVI
jgi:hypothetical protein